MRYLAVVVILLAAIAPAPAAEPPTTGVVAEVVDGDTVRLAGGGEVRLVGIQAPKLPLGRPGFAAWPLAQEARAALERMALNRTVSLWFGGRRMDRHGRWLAHLADDEGRWVQGEMLAQGWARVYTFPDNRARAAEMLAREAEAREAKRGIWAHPYYRILSADGASGHEDTFQLVEGRVRTVAERRSRTYVNFGEDYRSDFTITLDAAARRAFRDAGFDVAGLEGRRVRVRGWMKDWNGPMIEVTHPEQIEVLP